MQGPTHRRWPDGKPTELNNAHTMMGLVFLLALAAHVTGTLPLSGVLCVEDGSGVDHYGDTSIGPWTMAQCLPNTTQWDLPRITPTCFWLPGDGDESLGRRFDESL
jgi:hypothetical protein